MAKEFNPIDKKSLIIYSIILVIVIIVSVIVTRTPTKETTQISTPVSKTIEIPAEIGSGTTEASGYRIREGWQIYKGISFDINYPINFTPSASPTNELVTFSSSNGQQKLIIYSPSSPGDTPTEFIFNESIEEITDSTSGKNQTCTSQICSREVIAIQSKDKSYAKKIIISKNDIGKVTTAFAFQYPTQASSGDVSGILSLFQESLSRHAN